MSHVTFYRSLSESESAVRRREVVEKIRMIQERDDFCNGVHSMVTELRRFGVNLSHNTVDKYMSENELHSRQRIRKFPKNYYKTMKEAMKNLPRNILNRNFHVGVPRNIYVTDITYVPVVGGWVYKCIMKDLFNNEIVAWSMSAHPDAELCVRTFEMLAQRRDLRGAIIHSDMGSTYTSRAYRTRLMELGAVQSMSRKGNCWDNACAESYFAVYKTECFCQSRKDLLYHRLTKEEVFLKTDAWVEKYNRERAQEKLGWLSPVMYRWFYPNGRLLALPAPDQKRCA